MWSSDKHCPARGFLTPQPPAWKKIQSTTVLPMSERKRISPANNGDCFHVIHKVPASDSPYGRAKHVQLIDKDPSKAVSLFWAAINAGDRVDSALKDMAVVMKQLNRSDEAIEAIKSFRHLCPYDSQESLDNVLVELYKRSGRVDEEIEILQNKLRNIEEGTVFGGKKTKIARSQGKKIQITIEQEKSRILGNLAWAYLQQHNYGIAEQHYRKALSLEPDKNKQCNLAICLMHMNRLGEAKSLLQDVKVSAGTEEMDESYSKSYERAMEILMQVETQSKLEPAGAQEPEKGNETRRCLTSCRDRSLKEASVFLPRNGDNIPWCIEKNGNLSGYDDTSSSQCTPIGLKGSFQCSPQTMLSEKWRKGSYFESPSEGSVYSSSKLKESWRYSAGQEVGSAHKNMYASLAASRKNSEKVLLTQPRRCSWGFNTADQRRAGRWGEDTTVRNSIRKLSFEQTATTESVPSPSIQKLKEEPLSSSNSKTENYSAVGLGEEEAQEGLSGVLFTQPRNSLSWLNNRDQRRGRWAEESIDGSFSKLSSSVTTHSVQSLNVEPLVSSKDESEIGVEKPADAASNKKTWADMVEEEEKDEFLNDENLNSNIIYQHPDRSKHHIENITQQLESFGVKGGYNASANTVSSRRNRLQVFRDITST
ncbi:hypothetical protein Godav_008408 [Gossypium davidsonii]|uniref:Uncharacterized protein n=2 Tax=Gossypium TaxID=3633 RepID=A0A7J8SBH7_GOSDV|nr:hypothetical protein [Gossypium davidsonii]MBA0658440.1 hypothetical protein [Gossypium klotzschianum]